MYQLRKKILPIVLPSMVQAENFSGHPYILKMIQNTNTLCGESEEYSGITIDDT
jgi:alpha-D-ribose 1-methylphosphonate 5-phosphate C-P lyase